jgi:hypothetical protein
VPDLIFRGPRLCRVVSRLLFLTALACSPAHADHINSEGFGYASEISIVLTAQEKFYLVDPNNAKLFRESTTTRFASYKVWGTGLVATQNVPDDDDPHGPLKDMGMLLHEMGTNRAGDSTLELGPGKSPKTVKLRQNTVLVTRDGKKEPDVILSVDIEVAESNTTSEQRMRLRPTDAGRKAFKDSIVAMVGQITSLRREQIDKELATNGLRLVKGSERMEVSFPGDRELRIVVDPAIGAARVGLPDMRIVLFARIEQTYDEGGSSGRD